MPGTSSSSQILLKLGAFMADRFPHLAAKATFSPISNPEHLVAKDEGSA